MSAIPEDWMGYHHLVNRLESLGCWTSKRKTVEYSNRLIVDFENRKLGVFLVLETDNSRGDYFTITLGFEDKNSGNFKLRGSLPYTKEIDINLFMKLIVDMIKYRELKK